MAKQPKPQLRELTLPDLHPSRNQPRHTMSAETIAAIKAAIEDNGGEYPQDMAITVRPRLAGGFEIIAGHHRHMAAKDAGLKSMWAFVKELNDKEAFKQLVATNNQKPLTSLEHGVAAINAIRVHGLSLTDYARLTGKSTSSVSTYMSAVDLLSRFGGVTGHYAKLNYRVLAALRPIPSDELVGQILFYVWNSQPGPDAAIKAIGLIRQGMPMYKAFDVALGRRSLHDEPERRGPKHPLASESDDYGGPAAGTALMAWAAAGFNTAQVEAMMQVALYQQAQLEEYAARFGHLVANDDGFVNAVAARREALAAEHRAEREATKPKQAERKAS